MNILALVFAFMLPSIGLILGWAIAAYAIGRSLFVAVPMRRMSHSMAESLHCPSRGVEDGMLALAAYISVINPLIPIIGVATMVHVLDMALTAAETSGRQLVWSRVDVDNVNSMLFARHTSW